MAQRNTIEIIINATDKASSALGGVGSALTGIGKVALAGAAAVGAAAVGVGAAIGKMAIDAAPLQGIQGAFEGLAESAGVGADDMLAALQRGSAGMIAQRDLMMTFNKAAQLVSTDFAVNLPEAMGYLGKVATATGQDMDYMLNSLVVGVGRLSPMILDNLAIQVSLSEATERASEMFGVQADALTKEQQQAGMMNVVLEKLRENTASMPDVTGTATASMASLGAMFQDTKDAIGTAFLPVLQEVLGWIQAGATIIIPLIVTWLENFAERIGFLIQYFKTTISTGDALNGWLEELPSYIQPVVAIIGNLITVFQEWGGVVHFAESLLGELIALFTGFNADTYDTIDTLYALAAAFGVPTEDIMPLMNRVSELGYKFQDVFTAIKTWVERNWPKIRAAVLDAVEAIWDWVRANWPRVRDTILDAVETVYNWFVENWPILQDAATTAMQTIYDWVMTNWPTIRDMVLNSGQEMQSWFVANWPVMQAVAETAWTAIQAIIQAVVDVIINNVWPSLQSAFDDLSAALDALGITWEDVWNALKLAIEIVAAAIAAIIVGLIGVIVGIVTAVASMAEEAASWLDVLGDAFSDAIGSIIAVVAGFIEWWKLVIHGDWADATDLMIVNLKNLALMVGDIFGLIVTMVTASVNTLIALVRGFVEGVVEFFKNLYEELVGGSIVPQMMDDILNAITTGLGDALDAISTWVSDAISAIVGRVGDFIQAGADLMAGLKQGILDKVGEIISTVTGFIGDAVQAARSALGEHSPSEVFREIGRGIGEGLVAGINDVAADVTDAVDSLLQVGSTIGSFGTSIVRIYESRFIDPLTESIESTQGLLSGVTDRIAGYRDEILGMGFTDWWTTASVWQLQDQLLMARLRGASQELIDRISAAIVARRRMVYWEGQEANLLDQIAQMEADRAEALAKAEDIRKAQEDLAFLGEQIKLLRLIQDYGLDATKILGGMTLGLGADVEQLVDATGAALEAIVTQLQEATFDPFNAITQGLAKVEGALQTVGDNIVTAIKEMVIELENILGIASPSKVFQRIGESMMQGLALGVKNAAFMADVAIQGAAGTMAASASRTVNNNFTMNVNTRESRFDVMNGYRVMQSVLGAQ